MNIPTTNLITGTMVFLGMHPVHEKRQTDWCQKLHYTGLFFCLVQIVLTIYTFLLELKERAFDSSSENNIILGFVAIKKGIALLLPLYTILLQVIPIRPLEKFFDKTALFDVFLKATDYKVSLEYCTLERDLIQRARKVNFVAGIFILLAVLFNIVTAYSYMIMVRKRWPNVYTLYFYHSPLAIFITSSVSTFCKLYGVLLRHELFNEFVKDILESGWQTERVKRMKRLQILRGLTEQEENGLVLA